MGSIGNTQTTTQSPRATASNMTYNELQSYIQDNNLTREYNMMINNSRNHSYQNELRVMRDLVADKEAVKNAKANTHSFPGVDGIVSSRINTVISDSRAMETEQTIFIGERVGRTDTTLNAEQKKSLIAEVKQELKKRGLKKNVTITTPKMGPNMYTQYLNIR